MRIIVVFTALLFFLPSVAAVKTTAAEAEAAPGREAVVIHTAGQLADIQARAAAGCAESLSADYVLGADIDLTGLAWVPIGNVDANARYVFGGTFDGAGFTIRGLGLGGFDSERGADGRAVTIGLFGKTEGAVIRNLTLENASLNAVGEFGRKEFCAGLLVGEAIGGRLENIVLFGGEVYAVPPDGGSGAAGGLVGKATGTVIEYVQVKDIKIESHANVPLRAAGLLAGCLDNCAVENVLVLNAEISANALAIGGFAGEVTGGGFSDCGAEIVYVTGRAENTGGFAGHVRENAAFENCQATGQVQGTGVTGGFAGRVSGSQAGTGASFTRCRAFADVNAGAAGSAFAPAGTTLAGGFAGRLAGRSRVAHSHAGGTVISDGSAGGFVGEIANASRIEFSAAYGAVYGGTAAAGFAAIISDIGAPNTITSSLALGGAVAGPSPDTTRRFAAVTKHNGINNCFAYLGMALIADGSLLHVIPNPFGRDGGDISRARLISAI